MRKLKLSEWASLSEIVGTVAVVISLIFVGYSLQRNTVAISGQGVNEIYDANKEIQLVLLTQPDLEAVIEKGQNDFSRLSDPERRQYMRYLYLHLDIWERAITRQHDGLIDASTVSGWNQYYTEFFRRHLPRDAWEKIRWEWTDPEFLRRIDAALEK